jgi:Sec-independent protein translocase protein TatA
MSLPELFLTTFVAFLVLGPQELKKLAHWLGKVVYHGQKGLGTFKNLMDQEISQAKLQDSIKKAETADKLYPSKTHD